MIELNDRIDLLARLGKMITKKNDALKKVIQEAHFHNQWFTIDNINVALDAIAEQFLTKDKLEKWVADYPIATNKNNRNKIGIVLAGNIPLVGFHDVISCFVAGHISMIKLSSKDKFLLPFLIEYLIEQDSRAESYFEYIEILKGIDAVITTGSNNSADHFEYYFSKYPNIIRRNRNGIAIITGNETKEELIDFGNDIFSYFGLGCRNVSKIYIPKDYDIKILIEVMHDHYKEVILHHKYKNNFDYNYAIYLMNKDKFLMSGSLIWREDASLTSRIACIHYEKYDNIQNLESTLTNIKDQIQCVIGNTNIKGFQTVKFGEGQKPRLDEYADGIDTMKFLTGLNA